MKKDEAIKVLIDYVYKEFNTNSILVKAIKTILDYHTPSKHYGGYCPRCGTTIMGYQNIPLKYCSECGQKINTESLL